MVIVPAGSFVMGSPEEETQREGITAEWDREKPLHAVTIVNRFAVSSTEITRGQFALFVRETSRREEPEVGCDTLRFHAVRRPPLAGWRNPGYPQRDDHPVVCVK